MTDMATRAATGGKERGPAHHAGTTATATDTDDVKLYRNRLSQGRRCCPAHCRFLCLLREKPRAYAGAMFRRST